MHGTAKERRGLNMREVTEGANHLRSIVPMVLVPFAYCLWAYCLGGGGGGGGSDLPNFRSFLPARTRYFRLSHLMTGGASD
jgi:hypothetical protein